MNRPTSLDPDRTFGFSIFYIGQLWEGGTALARLRSLERLGCRVDGFDVTPYYNPSCSLEKKIEHRLLVGRNISRLNRDLQRRAAKFDRAPGRNLVWIDKGTWIYPETMRMLSKQIAPSIVHYTPDTAFSVHTSRHFRRSIKYYTICATTKSYEISNYYDSGAKKTIFCLQGIDSRFSYDDPRLSPHHIEREGVVFIGHFEPYYEEILNSLSDFGNLVKIYGPGWENTGSKYLKACVQPNTAWGPGYPAALSKAKIGLGLLSKRYPDQFTTRSFELPAAGLLMLAERTLEHKALFAEDTEAVYFATTEELRRKIQYYLMSDTERTAIATRGQDRALKHYNWENVLLEILVHLETTISETLW
jgi:spore maturation protein CgeB